MPQMAPMWWTTLFILFILTFIIMMIMMYFFNIYSIKLSMNKDNSTIKNINWKW